MTDSTKKRGRPRGSKTHFQTPSSSMQRALEFFALLENGVGPTAAARAVTENWPMVVESTVFHDASRYVERMTFYAKREERAAYIEVAQMMRLYRPDLVALIEDKHSLYLKDQLAARLGIDPLERVISEFDFKMALGESWLVMIGLLLVAVFNAESNEGC